MIHDVEDVRMYNDNFIKMEEYERQTAELELKSS